MQQSVPIIRDVSPLPSVTLSEICVEVNSSSSNERVDEIIIELLAEANISSRPRQAAFPGECEIWLTYSVTYSGRVIKMVQTANLTVYDSGKRLGYIRYDATQAHGRPDRHGTLKEKLRPLVTQLLKATSRPS